MVQNAGGDPRTPMASAQVRTPPPDLPTASLYLWCGTIHHLCSSRGVDILFVKLDANEQGTWYTTAEGMHNLARLCLRERIAFVELSPYMD